MLNSHIGYVQQQFVHNLYTECTISVLYYSKCCVVQQPALCTTGCCTIVHVGGTIENKQIYYA